MIRMKRPEEKNQHQPCSRQPSPFDRDHDSRGVRISGVAVGAMWFRTQNRNIQLNLYGKVLSRDAAIQRHDVKYAEFQ